MCLSGACSIRSTLSKIFYLQAIKIIQVAFTQPHIEANECHLKSHNAPGKFGMDKSYRTFISRIIQPLFNGRQDPKINQKTLEMQTA